jgi:hypothetical protein
MKIIFLILISCISLNAHSAWEKTGKSDGLMTYVDTSSIKRNGYISSMRGLFDNDKPSLVSGQEVRSSISQFEFNCQKRTYRTISYSLYSGQMGGGRQLIEVRKDSQWESVAGFDEFAWKIACGYITKK